MFMSGLAFFGAGAWVRRCLRDFWDGRRLEETCAEDADFSVLSLAGWNAARTAVAETGCLIRKPQRGSGRPKQAGTEHLGMNAAGFAPWCQTPSGHRASSLRRQHGHI